MPAAIRTRLPIGPGDSSRAAIRQRLSPPQQPAAGMAPPPEQPAPAGNKRRDFFAYTIAFSSLLAGTATQGAIQIQADSDFELNKFTMFADIAAAAETEATRVLPLVTLQLTDTGTGRALFNAPLPIPAVMGDGRIPFILPVPKIFSANASVAIEVANFALATDYNLRLCLIGAKIFTYGA